MERKLLQRPTYQVHTQVIRRDVGLAVAVQANGVDVISMCVRVHTAATGSQHGLSAGNRWHPESIGAPFEFVCPGRGGGTASCVPAVEQAVS